jgi:hypothetical protein
MPLKVLPVTQDATFPGGLCLVTMEPVSNDILVEQPAEARDHDTWNARMAGALAPLKCQILQSTSDEAPGLLAYGASHLGMHHSPDLCHVQQELSKAVSAPLGTKQRAAAKAAAKTAETLQRVQVHSQNANTHPERRGPGRPPKALPSVEQAIQDVEAARHEYQRLTHVREQGSQCMRASGRAYHFVDLERGVRRNDKLIASDIQEQLDTMRAIAQQEHLSETCLNRSAKAERGVPKRHTTIPFVSG